MMEPLLLVVMVPLTGAVVTLLTRGRVLACAAAISTLLTFVAAVSLALQVTESGPQTHAVGGWGASLGIELRADGLSALMVLLTTSVASLVGLYGHTYFRPNAVQSEPGDMSAWATREAFWPLWLFLLGALGALYVSADIFNIYVTLELVTLSAISLMALSGARGALSAGMRYLLAAVLGSMAYLLGVALLYAEFDTLSLVALGGVTTATTSALAAVALMTAGLLLKTALFPLHFWLPRAHAFAPAPVSAALSALVVNGSFYVLLRVWFTMAPGVPTVEAAQLLGLLGSAAIIWGSLQAIRAKRLKLLIAYSTVAQVGFLFLLLPLTLTGASGDPGERPVSAWHGGMLHLVSHSFAKAAMFLAAGNVVVALGHDLISDLRGLAMRLPVTMLAFAVAGTSLIGVPPLGGFFGKLLLLDGVTASGQWFYAVVILGGTLLTAAYVFRVVGVAMQSGDPPGQPRAVVPLPRVLEVSPLILALVALILGVAANPLLRLLDVDGFGATTTWPGG